MQLANSWIPLINEESEIKEEEEEITYEVILLIINELKYNVISTIGLKTEENDVHVVFICQSADTFVFEGKSN
ncbi:unnamed protein product [Cunninghamella blakesleeana]